MIFPYNYKPFGAFGDYMRKLYDFICKECEYPFEKLTTLTEKIECPNCGSLNTERQFSPTSFKVTGQGQYSSKMKV